MKFLADLRAKMFALIGKLGFDGWFYVIAITLLTIILARFLPMFTCVVFSACVLWFVDFVKYFAHIDNRSNKPIYCGFAGTLLGIGLCYVIYGNLIWF